MGESDDQRAIRWSSKIFQVLLSIGPNYAKELLQAQTGRSKTPDHRRHGWEMATNNYMSAEKSNHPIEQKRVQINLLLGLDSETRISYKNWITVHTEQLLST